jgi:hypothetical protein
MSSTAKRTARTSLAIVLTAVLQACGGSDTNDCVGQGATVLEITEPVNGAIFPVGASVTVGVSYRAGAYAYNTLRVKLSDSSFSSNPDNDTTVCSIPLTMAEYRGTCIWSSSGEGERHLYLQVLDADRSTCVESSSRRSPIAVFLGSPVAIDEPPQNVSVTEGESAEFRVRASGASLVQRWTPRTASANLVPGLGPVLEMACGYESHSMAVKVNGEVWMWGRNNRGQLGDGTTTTRTSPAQVPGLNLN